MTWKAVRWVLAQTELTPAQRVVLMKLADHATRDGYLSYVGVDTIAQWAGLTPRHVRRALGELIRQGHVTVDSANGRKGGRRPTTYAIPVPAGFDGDAPALEVVEAPQGAGSSKRRADICDTPGRTSKTRTPDSMSAEPKVNQEDSPLLRNGPGGAGAWRCAEWEKLVREGTPILQALVDLRDEDVFIELCSLHGAAGSCERVLNLLHEAARLRPARIGKWLYSKARRGRNKTTYCVPDPSEATCMADCRARQQRAAGAPSLLPFPSGPRTAPPGRTAQMDDDAGGAGLLH